MALFAGAAVTAVLTIFDQGGGGALGWQQSDPVWTHALRVVCGAVGWFLADLMLIRLRSLRRREA